MKHTSDWFNKVRQWNLCSFVWIFNCIYIVSLKCWGLFVLHPPEVYNSTSYISNDRSGRCDIGGIHAPLCPQVSAVADRYGLPYLLQKYFRLFIKIDLLTTPQWCVGKTLGWNDFCSSIGGTESAFWKNRGVVLSEIQGLQSGQGLLKYNERAQRSLFTHWMDGVISGLKKPPLAQVCHPQCLRYNTKSQVGPDVFIGGNHSLN